MYYRQTFLAQAFLNLTVTLGRRGCGRAALSPCTLPQLQAMQ